MGRLQKKKNSGSKKKKRTVDAKQLSQPKSNVHEKRSTSLAGSASDTNKGQAFTQRQISSSPISPVAGIGFINKALQFLREVKVELKKVTWPTRQQTIGSTVVVLILVIIISFFLGGVDVGLDQLVRIILQ